MCVCVCRCARSHYVNEMYHHFLWHFCRLSLFAARKIGISYFFLFSVFRWASICALKVIAKYMKQTDESVSRVCVSCVCVGLIGCVAAAMSNDSMLSFFPAHGQTRKKTRILHAKRERKRTHTQKIKMYSLDHEMATLGFLYESARVVGSCMRTLRALHTVKINLEFGRYCC